MKHSYRQLEKYLDELREKANKTFDQTVKPYELINNFIYKMFNEIKNRRDIDQFIRNMYVMGFQDGYQVKKIKEK